MEKWKELIEKSQNEPMNAGVWEEIMTFAENRLNTIQGQKLREAVLGFFQNNHEVIPNEVQIVMDREWEADDSYLFLASVSADDVEHPALKDYLNINFDITSLSNNPIINFSTTIKGASEI